LKSLIAHHLEKKGLITSNEFGQLKEESCWRGGATNVPPDILDAAGQECDDAVSNDAWRVTNEASRCVGSIANHTEAAAALQVFESAIRKPERAVTNGGTRVSEAS
jgi:hypothetical protein